MPRRSKIGPSSLIYFLEYDSIYDGLDLYFTIICHVKCVGSCCTGFSNPGSLVRE